MRYLLLTLLTAFLSVLSAQPTCSIEVDLQEVSCNPNGLINVSFSVTGSSDTLWFSPNLDLLGSYNTGEVFTGTLFNLEETGGLLLIDVSGGCEVLVPIDIPCGSGGCADLSVTIEPEQVMACENEEDQFWIISVNDGLFPIQAVILNPEGEIQETLTFTQISSWSIFAFPGQQYTVEFTDAEGCTYTEFFFTEIVDCGSVTGRSWLDENGDGIRGENEVGIVNAVVTLLSPQNNQQPIQTVETGPDGTYFFDGLQPFSSYLLRIEPLEDGRELTLFQQGDNPNFDNDFSPAISSTGVFSGNAGETLVMDAGWVSPGCDSLFAQVITGDSPGSCVPVNQFLFVQAQNYPVNVVISFEDSNQAVQEFVVTADGTTALSDLPTGTYRVSLVDAEGCSRELIFTQFVDFNIPVEIVQIGDLCTDGQVTLIAEVFGNNNPEDFTFQWSNGMEGQAITVEEANQIYIVEVFNTDNCSGVAEFWVSGNFADTIDIPQQVILPCDGSGIAAVSVTDPIPNAVYSWFGPQGFAATGTTVELSFPGWYEVMVESENGCQGFGFTQVIDYNLTNVEIISFNQQDSICGIGGCFGLTNLWNFNNETIEVEWDGPPEFNEWLESITFPQQSFCNVWEGTYTATIRTVCDTLVLTYEHGTLDCSELSGTLYLDSDGDCDLDSDDTPAPGFILTLTNDATGEMYYAWTDPNGNWAIELPDGSYTIEPIIEEGQPLETCPATSVTLGGSAVTGINIFMPVLFDCPLLTTEITIPWLRRCFSGCAYVNYENVGTATGEDAQVVVVLDPFFIDVIPSIDPVSVVGNVYTFDLGDLPPFSNGRIGFVFTVSCDAELGQAHCIDASITPDDPCHSDENWNGALVDITNVECLGDSIVFTVTNIGDNQMSIPLSYVIVEDGIMLSADPFTNGLLAPGEDYLVTVEADGSTVALITNQEPNAPGSAEPSTVFEGCNGEGETFSTGFSNLLPLSSGNPSSSFVCRENVGSYDPNDKNGYPLGWDGGNIEEGTRLDYEIRFQNTGTDTAFTVVISDTLEPSLDLATFKMEGASHDYIVTIDTHRVVTFTFNNIMLPDSNVNLLLSQGSVIFSIDHDERLVPGDVILNEAAIYFDFNEPVITNVSQHIIAKEGLPTGVRSVEAQSVQLSVYPNPASDLIKIDAPFNNIQANDFVVVTDLYGRALLSKAYGQLGQGLNISELPAGFYLLLVNDAMGRTRGRAPFVVASR